VSSKKSRSLIGLERRKHAHTGITRPLLILQNFSCAVANIRLRHRLMTTITVIMGLIRLALNIEEGGGLFQLKSAGAIGGIIGLAPAALFLTPCIYVISVKVIEWQLVDLSVTQAFAGVRLVATVQDHQQANSGTVVSIRRSVVDAVFLQCLPALYSALRTGKDQEIVLEVVSHIDSQTVRGITSTSTRGLAQAESIEDTGGPLKVPGGEKVLGRAFNVFGHTIDGKGELRGLEPLLSRAGTQVYTEEACFFLCRAS
jgi:hypothetical protein